MGSYNLMTYHRPQVRIPPPVKCDQKCLHKVCKSFVKTMSTKNLDQYSDQSIIVNELNVSNQIMKETLDFDDNKRPEPNPPLFWLQQELKKLQSLSVCLSVRRKVVLSSQFSSFYALIIMITS